MKRDLFSENARYVIDTCSLIDLNRWYPPTMAGGVWEKVDQLMQAGVLVSVEEVLEELKTQEDPVFRWAKKRKRGFLPLGTDLQRAAKDLLRTHPTLVDHKKRKSTADPFVVGAAKLLGAAVVTQETPSGRGERPKIPNVCHNLSIECISIVTMLEREGLRLVQLKGDDQAGGSQDVP